MNKGIRLLAWRMIVDYKKRAFVIGLAICMTAVLYTTLFSIVTHTVKSDQIFKQMYTGSDFHGSIDEISLEDAKKVMAHKLIKEAYVMSEQGYITDDNSSNEKIELYSSDDPKVLDHMFITVLEGRYPSNEQEILMDIEDLNRMNIPATVGRRIALEVEEDGIVEEHDYILSGYYVDETFSQYVSKKAFINHPEHHDTSVYFMLTNPLNIEGKVKQIWSDINQGYYDVNYAYTFSKEEWFDFESMIALFIALMIVFMSGFLLIYNIYGITFARDLRSYGLLKTLGTTRLQLRKIILYHTNLIYGLAMPIGLCLGYLIGGKILTTFFMSLSGLNMAFEFHWIIFVFTVLFTYFTTMISAMLPVKKLTRISCIQSLKGENSGKIKMRERHSTYGGKPFFMAIFNFSREPKKNIRMIGSISLSIILFIFVYTLTDTIASNEEFQYADFCIRDDVEMKDEKDTDQNEKHEVTYNQEDAEKIIEDMVSQIIPWTWNETIWYRDYEYRLTEEIVSKIEAIQGVEKVIPIYSTIVETVVGQLEGKAVNKDINYENESLKKRTLIQGKTKLYVCSMPEAGYEYLAKGISTSEDKDSLSSSEIIEKFTKNGYAMVGSYELNGRDTGGEDLGSISYYLPNDVISLNGLKNQYEVLALGRKGRGLISQLSALDYYPLITLDICLSYDDFRKEFDSYDIEAINIFVAEGSHDKVKAELSSILSPNAKLNDKREMEKDFQGYIRTIRIVGYSVSFIVLFIGILNYINTVVCGMYERRRELALLEIIGMTTSQMRRMLYCESGCFIGISALITFMIGLPMVRWTVMEMFEGNVIVSIVPMIGMLGAIIIIAWLTVGIAYKDMIQLTHIERL